MGAMKSQDSFTSYNLRYRLIMNSCIDFISGYDFNHAGSSLLPGPPSAVLHGAAGEFNRTTDYNAHPAQAPDAQAH
jgi:hypothetical protein